jgi:class 3 adenylate cyclase
VGEGSRGYAQTALSRHDEILRDTVESHRGYVFKEVGDAFCCAFASAPEAVGAAVAAQRALLEAPWDETGAIPVGQSMTLEQVVSYALGEGTEGKG